MREALKDTLREAGEIMLSAQDIPEKVREKEGRANFVTAYDVQVQKLLQKRLLELRPQARFLGEEGENQVDPNRGEVFIVDPIDGTTNFIHGLNASAVSVALLRDGVVILAAVLDPYRREFFYAEKGKGATCNGRPLHVADVDLSESIVCFGTAPYCEQAIPTTCAMSRVFLDHAVDLRRSGSAVIDLCQVARGAAGFFWEWQLCPWDYAACSLLITEAGGKIGLLDGSPLTFDGPCGVVAGAPRAWEEFFQKGLDRL